MLCRHALSTIYTGLSTSCAQRDAQFRRGSTPVIHTTHSDARRVIHNAMPGRGQTRPACQSSSDSTAWALSVRSARCPRDHAKYAAAAIIAPLSVHSANGGA